MPCSLAVLCYPPAPPLMTGIWERGSESESLIGHSCIVPVMETCTHTNIQETPSHLPASAVGYTVNPSPSILLPHSSSPTPPWGEKGFSSLQPDGWSVLCYIDEHPWHFTESKLKFTNQQLCSIIEAVVWTERAIIEAVVWTEWAVFEVLLLKWMSHYWSYIDEWTNSL